MSLEEEVNCLKGIQIHVLASFHFVCKSHSHLCAIRLLSGEHKGSRFVDTALQMFHAIFF